MSFWNSEEGQATTEYILMLSVAISLLLLVFKTLRPLYDRLISSTLSRIDRILFSKEGMHHLNIGR